MLKGFGVCYFSNREGKRQILRICLPGDMIGFEAVSLPIIDYSACVVSGASVALIDCAALGTFLEEARSAAPLFWDCVAADASVSRKWLVNAGSLSATARVAHFLCEFGARMAAYGLAETGSRMTFPFAQHDLADCLGLSTVQINRSLMQLREQGLLHLEYRELELLDPLALQEFAEFEPDYLHLGTTDQAPSPAS